MSTPTDTLTHTYTPAVAQHTSLLGQAIRAWYVLNCSGGADTVTFASSSGTSSITGICAEFSGIATSAALDQTGTGSGTGTAVSSVSGTTTVNDELVVGIMTYDASTTTITPGQTQLRENENNATAAALSGEYQIVTSTGTKTSSWTLGASRDWITDNFTLKIQPSASTVKQLAALGVG